MSEASDAPKRNFDPLDEVALADNLAFENKDLIERVDVLVKAAEEWIAGGDITTDQQAEDLAAFIKQIAGVAGDKGAGNVRREVNKKPYDACSKTVQTFFMTKVLNPLATPRGKLLTLANAYLDKKRREAAAEQERLRKAALAAMEQAKTAEQVKAAGAAMKAADKPASVGVRSDFGAKLHQTSRWAYDVLDITKVPHKFLAIDNAAVMAFIKTGTVEKPVEIPGITVKRVTGAVGT